MRRQRTGRLSLVGARAACETPTGMRNTVATSYKRMAFPQLVNRATESNTPA
jgi:hypothetical protein